MKKKKLTDKEVAIEALKRAKMYDARTEKELSFAFDVNVGGEDKDGYIRQVFLSHKFAKKFWPEKHISYSSYHTPTQKEWKYRLQVMVIEKNPLNYIKIFLED